ncbi:MAG: ribosomal L7Ae/L30e/S12e/Gadd45 family protein [Candidatus Caldarchaeum sp.]
MDVKQSLQVVSRTGKYVVGYRQTLKEIHRKRPVIVVASNKAERLMLDVIRINAKAVNIPVLLTDLTPSELGLALRKPFPTSFIAILEPGSSDIVEQAGVEQSG